MISDAQLRHEMEYMTPYYAQFYRDKKRPPENAICGNCRERAYEGSYHVVLITGQHAYFCSAECALEYDVFQQHGQLAVLLRKQGMSWAEAEVELHAAMDERWARFEQLVESGVLYHDFRDRAKKRGEKVDSLEVYTRGDFTCHICGYELRMRDVHPKPLAPTVDHVIALANGGEHTYDNCRPAHSICNTKKGDRTLTEAQVDELRHKVRGLLSLKVSA